MNTSSEAADQVVRMTLNGTEAALKITGAGAERVAKLLYSLLKDLKNENMKTKGHVRLRRLLKEGRRLEVFEIPDANVKQFCKLAGNYGMMYTVLRERHGKSSLTEIMVKSDDCEKLNHVFRRMNITADSLAGVDPERADTDREKKENRGPKRVSLGESGPDRFLDELMAGESSLKGKSGKKNPTRARAGKDRSVPSSGTTDRSAEEERRPSVRARLKKYRDEIAASDAAEKEAGERKVPGHIHVPKKKKTGKTKERE